MYEKHSFFKLISGASFKSQTTNNDSSFSTVNHPTFHCILLNQFTKLNASNVFLNELNH